MTPLSTRGSMHRRLSVFVDWIATEASREDEIRDQSALIRSRIQSRAEADGLRVVSTPNSGSFATRTGLRRHLRGEADVEGQDVDLPFVVKLADPEAASLELLLPRFGAYAEQAFPETKRSQTKSSIQLQFSNKLNYDLVPLLATEDRDRQILIRATGERRETSVQKHVEFVRRRTALSDEQKGRVKFNEMVRLLKWWRYTCVDGSGLLDEIPSFLINLLAAHAFDARGVQESYGATLSDWFGYLAHTVKTKRHVTFSDFGPLPEIPLGATWCVFDPLNRKNNVVEMWTGIHRGQLLGWLESARDATLYAISLFESDREGTAVDELVSVFGNPFKYHSEPD